MEFAEVIEGLKRDFYLYINIDPASISEELDHIIKISLERSYAAGFDYGWAWANKQAKPIYMKTPFGRVIHEFLSIREAARYVQGSATNIMHVLKNRQNTAYGYRWTYKNKEDEENID